MIRLVAEEELSILEADARDAQPMPESVFEIMNPDGSESGGACSSKTHTRNDRPPDGVRLSIPNCRAS